MSGKPIYVITETSVGESTTCTERTWTPSQHYAALYAKMCMSKGHNATIERCDEREFSELTDETMLQLIPNNVGEKFLLSETTMLNAINLGAWKIVSNKYLTQYKDYFNRNGAGALFATVHVFCNELGKFIKDNETKNDISHLFDWILTNIEKECELDYFTYYTITSERIRNHKVGGSLV